MLIKEILISLIKIYQAHMSENGEIDAIYHLTLKDGKWTADTQQITGEEKQEVIKTLASRN